MKCNLEEDEMIRKNAFMYVLFVVFLLNATTAGFSAEDIVQSTWAAMPPTIDGLDDDWQGGVMTADKKVKVNYAIRNDAQFMYVLFVFSDLKYLSNINATGLTLYYNTEGKKKKDHAFNFTMRKVSGEELIAYLKSRGEVLTEQQLQAVQPTNMYNVFMTERTGKKDKEITIAQPIPGVLNPGFKINKKGDALMYEFMIPMTKSENSPRGMGVEPGESLKIGFEWGGMTEALMKRLSAGGGGGDASAEGRAGGVIDSTRGGRSRGGSGGAPRTGRMPKKYSFWTDVKLAQNQ